MELRRLITLISALGFLFWTGSKAVMQTFIGDKIVYPMIILSLATIVTSNLLEEEKAEIVDRVSYSLVVSAMVIYLVVWGGRHWIGAW